MSGFARRLQKGVTSVPVPLGNNYLLSPHTYGYPDATNTGVPAGTVLTVVNGDLTITADGTVVDGKDVHGFITISANNVTVQNTRVRGRSTSSNSQLISAGGSNILIQNCTLANEYPSPWVDGMSVSNTTIKNLNISGTTDGLKAASNTTIQNCYIHDMTYFTSDPNQGGGPSHNDAIQILQGDTINIFKNTLVPGANSNSAIQVTQDWGAVTNLSIYDNIADYGNVVFNIAWKGGGNMSVNVNNNRFGHNSYYDVGILIGTKVTMTGSNNVWDADGTPTTIQQHD